VAAANAFAATTGSSIITVTDNAHGAQAGDFVTFAGAASLGGNVTAAILNAEHRIATYISSSQYTIVVSVVANASDSGNGGASTTAAYQITLAAMFTPWALAGVQVAGAAYLEQPQQDGALRLLRVWVLAFSFAFGLRQTLGKT
jgi:hypothetical protein